MLWFLLLATSSDALFFGLGGEGGCSCPSSCGAPPPANFGCRMMCAHTPPVNCNSYQGSYGQTSYGQTYSGSNNNNNYGYQQQPQYSQSNQPAYQQSYQNFDNSYARPQQQYQPVVNYIPPAPPAPTRFVDNYAQTVARVAENFERRPIPPVAPPVYTPQTYGTAYPAPAPVPPAPLPSESQGSQGTYATASETAHQQQISLLPPATETEAQPQEQEHNSQPSVTYNSGATEVPLREAPAWSGSISSPEEIVKSIEDSYDERSEELMEPKEANISQDRKNYVQTIETNQVTILPTVSYGSPTDTPDISAPIVEIKPSVAKETKTKTIEYALGGPMSYTTSGDDTVSSTTSAIVFKTLTRSEGYSSDNISASGYAYKGTTDKPTADEEYDEDFPTKPQTEQTNSIKAEGNYDAAQRTIEESSNERKIAAKRSQDPSSFKCNSNKLRDIMEEKMSSSAPVSKQLIYASATREFPGLSLDVICSRHSFSYIVVTSPIYCEHRKASLTCFAFFQP